MGSHQGPSPLKDALSLSSRATHHGDKTKLSHVEQRDLWLDTKISGITMGSY